MQIFLKITIIGLLITVYNCTAPKVLDTPKLTAESQLPSAIYQQSIEKVVLITPISQQSIGTGVIIDKNGMILTNWHIVGDNKLVWVAFNNPKAITKEDYKSTDWKIGEVVAIDPTRDLALIDIDSIEVEPFEFGKADELRVGQEVYSISHPQGQIFSFTKGLISKLPDKLEMLYHTEKSEGQTNIITRAALFFGLQDTAKYNNDQKIIANAIQLQFPKNEGSSGGPIINSQGHLIGINSTAKRFGESLSFAIRIEEIIEFLDFNPSSNDIEILEKYIDE